MSRTSRNLILLLAVVLGLSDRAFASPTPILAITITGVEQQSSAGVWDTGTTTVTINGISASIAYGQYSTPASIASGLAAMISSPPNCSFPVFAKATSAVINFYAKGTNTITSATVSSTSSNPSAFPNPSFQIDGNSGASGASIPVISLSPSSGISGSSLTINAVSGTNFGNTQGLSSVSIGSVVVTPTYWSYNTITVTVPALSPVGPYPVTVTVNNLTSYTVPFTVTSQDGAISTDVCASAIVNSTQRPHIYFDGYTYNTVIDVEQTVCYIAPNYYYVETDNDSYDGNPNDLAVYGVGAEAQIVAYDGSVLYDTGMIYGSTSATGGSTALASTGYAGGYWLSGYYTECDNLPNTDPSQCSWEDTVPEGDGGNGPTFGLRVVVPTPASVISVATSGSPSGFGQPVTFTATVGAGVTGQEVVFFDGGGYLGTGTINGTTATFTTSALQGGTNSITAAWGGDNFYDEAVSTSPLMQVVTPLSPTLTIACPQNMTFGYGFEQVCQLVVNGGDPNTEFWYGDVSVLLNGQQYTAYSVGWDEAYGYNIGLFSSNSFGNLLPGTYSLVVNWSGDENDAAASASTTFTIQKAPSSFILSCAYPVIYGNNDTDDPCTARLPNNVSGSVTFTVNGRLLGVVTLSGAFGKAIVSIPGLGKNDLPSGTTLVAAAYSGDTNFNPFTAYTTVTIYSSSPSMSVSCTPNPVFYGSQTISCAALVGGGATGTVTFSYNGNNSAPITISGGTATFSGFANLPPGVYDIVANYSGDSNNWPISVSTTLTIQNPMADVLVSCSPNPVYSGSQAVSCTASVDAAATGTITFSYNGNNSAPITISGGTATFSGFGNLPPGIYDIVANYSGDSNYKPSSGSTSLDDRNSGSTPGTLYTYTVPTTGSYGAANGYQGGYDTNGNVLAYTDTVMGSWTFEYDQLNRLTGATTSSAVNGSTNFCWAYDSFGNRRAQGASNAAFPANPSFAACISGATLNPSSWARYNAQNQVTGTTQAPGGYSYDAAGDVIYDGANGYLYDAEGRICAVTNGDGWTGYLYDAAGNRVAKGNITNPNGTCDITSNGFTPTAGYVVGPSGEQLTEVAWVSGGWNQWNHTNVYAGGKLIGTYDGNVAAPTLHFHIDDPLGTRRAQVSSTGVLEATYQSLPFGDGLNSIPYTTTAEDPTENHFTGKERDTESGNDYFLARYYNSATGRFLSPDWSAKEEPVPYAKLDNPQSLNLYSYMFNNPLGGVDKDGHGCGGPGEAPCPAATPAATPTSPQPFTVTLNSRAANIPGGGVLHDLGADHQWITTSDGQAAGMGSAKNGGQIPDKKGNSSPDKPLDPTMVVDEHGDKPTSTQTFTNVDKGAISSYLQVGQPTGPWIPGGNDCNTWAKNAISQSTPHDITYTPAGAPDLVPSTRVVQHNVVVYSDGSVHQPGGQQ